MSDAVIDTAVVPFRVAIPDDDLADLRARLDRVRWAPEPADGDTGDGLSVDTVRALVRRWRDEYDWRAWEARLNAYPQFTTTIDGATVHFLHVRSPEPDALPLVLTHGWPGTVAEYVDVLDLLSNPRHHGLDPGVAFDLVVPSLPGSGFSGPTPDTGWGPRRIARAWAELMRRVGHDRYGAAGNDWGSFVSLELGRLDPDAVAGVHVAQAWTAPPAGEPIELSPEDQAAAAAFADYAAHHSSYGTVAAQAPRTLAHALADSPVGLLGWNGQAMVPYGLDDEAVLTHVSVHWFAGTAASAVRIYGDALAEGPPDRPLTAPLGVAQFAGDLPSVRAFAERAHPGLTSWNTYDRGGHYAAHNAPELLVGDLRQFFGGLRG
jgi:pimeloyl-ACP methyl ester carboxylesterase